MRGLAAGLGALHKAGYAIDSYAWVDTNPDAHATVSHRLKRMRQQYPQLLPLEAIRDCDSRIPMDARAISPKLFATTFSEVIDLLLANPPMLAQHPQGPTWNTCRMARASFTE